MAMPMSGVNATFYLDETTYGSMVASGVWQWFGLVNPLAAALKKNKKRIPYLGDATSDLSKVRYVNSGGSLNAKLTYTAQDYDFFEAYTYGSLSYFSLMQIMEDEADSETNYMIYLGGTVDDATLTYNEFGEVTADYGITMSAVPNPTTTAPAGATFESEPAAAVLEWEDVTNLTWNGSAFSDITGEFKFSVKNGLKYPRDKAADTWTKIGGPKLTLREYEFSIAVTYQSLDLFDDVRDSTKGTITWTSGGKTFSVTNMVFGDMDLTQDPEAYLGSTMVAKSDGAVLTIT